MVSILKPLAGLDDDLEANLASFVDLDGPPHELLLGVAGLHDPAFDLARCFVDAHPRLNVRLVLTDPNAAINPKVAQLIGLARVARGERLVISDSNVCVTRDYLHRLVAHLHSEDVGLVSNLIVGTGERTLGAAVENYVLLTHVATGVLASSVFGRPITVGKSLAFRRRDLDALGGFEELGNYLAEDHALARMMRRSGKRVAVEVLFGLRNTWIGVDAGRLHSHIEINGKARSTRACGQQSPFVRTGIVHIADQSIATPPFPRRRSPACRQRSR